MARLTDDFLTNFYYGLREDYLERVKGEKKPLSEVFLGLTRNNPVMITCDQHLVPNGAVKSVGYILKKQYLQEAIGAYDQFLNWRWAKIQEQMGSGYEGQGWVYSPNPAFIVDGLRHSIQYVYFDRKEAEKKVNFEVLGTLEGFGKKSWENVRQNTKAAIVYYYPPGTHFQVTCTVEVIENKVDRLAGIVDEQPTHAHAAIEWDAGEVTRNQTQEQIYARAKLAERERNSLEAHVAALEARLAERDRQSDRVRDDTRARVDRRSRIVIAIASGGVGVAALELVRYLLGG